MPPEWHGTSMRKRNPTEPLKPMAHWGAVPPSEVQNQLGCSYVRAVVAYAGCMALEHKITDFGVDFSARYVSTWGGHPVPGKLIDIQLKSSYAVTESRDFIKYNMDRLAYDKLRRDAELPQILVLFAMPRDASLWLNTSTDRLVMTKCAYWLDMRGFQPKAGTHPQVAVPRSQIFGIEALLGPIRELVYTW